MVIDGKLARKYVGCKFFGYRGSSGSTFSKTGMSKSELI
jgi:hypothetical protein